MAGANYQVAATTNNESDPRVKALSHKDNGINKIYF